LTSFSGAPNIYNYKKRALALAWHRLSPIHFFSWIPSRNVRQMYAQHQQLHTVRL